MKTSDLTVSGVYGYAPQQLNQQPSPALVLDLKAWMAGTDPGPQRGTQRLTIAQAPRQNIRLARLEFTTPLMSGIPVIVLKASTYRWIADDPSERIATPAAQLLAKAEEQFGEDMLGEYDIPMGSSINAPFRTKVVAVRGDGRKAEIEAELIMIRTQNLIGAWASVLGKEQDAHDRAKLTDAERAAAQNASDVLDREIADRVDALLADGKPRTQYTGLRPDVVRYRGAGELQISVETFLKLLELAEGPR